MIYKFHNEFIDILQKIYNDKYNSTYKLNHLHNILDSEMINENEKKSITSIKELGKDRISIFYDDYHYFIDNNSIFNEIYHKFINKYIKPLYTDNINNKIVIQKTPNIRISFPNLTAIGKKPNENIEDNIIGLHKDADFGHHEDEINVIIPITKMFETNSIFYEPFINSNISTNDYLNLNLNTDEFFINKFNKLLHFNKINKTGLTRISLDFRIIPYNKYFNNLLFFKNTKFELGNYYIVL